MPHFLESVPLRKYSFVGNEDSRSRLSQWVVSLGLSELKAINSILALCTQEIKGLSDIQPVSPFSFPAPFPARKSSPRKV